MLSFDQWSQKQIVIAFVRECGLKTSPKNFEIHLIKCARNRSFVDGTSLQVSNRVLFPAYVLSKHVYNIVIHFRCARIFLWLIIKLTLLVQRIPKKMMKHGNFLSLHKNICESQLIDFWSLFLIVLRNLFSKQRR